MKTCSRCGIEKDVMDFQVRKASRDGLTASCKSCLSEYDKLRANNPDRVKARAEYAKTDAGREASRRASRKFYAEHKESALNSKAKWAEKNPKKRKVHGIVAYAIRTGYLVKHPCIICGDKESHAHHCDYDKPLDVMWLCSMHHGEWHSKNGEGKNG